MSLIKMALHINQFQQGVACSHAANRTVKAFLKDHKADEFCGHNT